VFALGCWGRRTKETNRRENVKRATTRPKLPTRGGCCSGAGKSTSRSLLHDSSTPIAATSTTTPALTDGSSVLKPRIASNSDGYRARGAERARFGVSWTKRAVWSSGQRPTRNGANHYHGTWPYTATRSPTPSRTRSASPSRTSGAPGPGISTRTACSTRPTTPYGEITKGAGLRTGHSARRQSWQRIRRQRLCFVAAVIRGKRAGAAQRLAGEHSARAFAQTLLMLGALALWRRPALRRREGRNHLRRKRMTGAWPRGPTPSTHSY